MTFRYKIFIFRTIIVLGVILAGFITFKIATRKGISWSNVNGRKIAHLVINDAPGVSIRLANCKNDTIEYCHVANGKGIAIVLYNCTGIVIQKDTIYNVPAGVLATDCRDIKVNDNVMKNMTRTRYHADFVQFDNVNGAGNRILRNKCQDDYGHSNAEDAINLYKSNGVKGDSILIMGNQIRGGGPSKTGGGIMLGDEGGSYQSARNNILVNPGQYGIAVSGGTGMNISDNQIYSARFFYSNVGLYYHNYSKFPSSDVTMARNKIKWINGTVGGSNTWFPDFIPKGANTNILNANIGNNLLPDPLVK